MTDDLIGNGGPQPTAEELEAQRVAAAAVQTPEQIEEARLAAAEADAAKLKAVEQVSDNKGVITYAPTGDTGLDLALEFFGKHGFALNSAEMQEAGKGNFQYLEAKLAELGDKAPGAERYLALAKDAHKRLGDTEKAAYEARKGVVFEVVGGEENWKQIQAFVKANAEPEELEQVKAALKQGGVAARAMAKLLHDQWAASPDTVINPKNPAPRQNGNQKGGSPLTRNSYLQELNALAVSIGGSHRFEGSPEYAALRAKYANVK